MANIKYSAVVADARGKIGGTIFSRNRGGSYARTFTAPVQPRTPRQTAVRAILSQFSQLWGSLTQQQRDAFNAAAANFPRTNKLGESFRLTGHQMFVRINAFLAGVNTAGGSALGELTFAPVLDAPTVPGHPPLVVLGGTAQSAGGIFWGTVGGVFEADWAPGGELPEDTYVVAEMTLPYAPGRSFVPESAYRRVYVYGPGVNIGNLDFQDALNDLEIGAIDGWKVRMRFTPFTSTGRIGSPVVIEQIIVPQS